ncbi:MAG: hypothetical protein WC654_04635 [Patescibacteria group bacterium]
MNREPFKIEDLLETIGSVEIIGDSIHRYELRRSLLCSRFFEAECVRHSQWNRLLTYTAPLVAGGVMVGVFSLFAISISGSESDPSAISSSAKVFAAHGEPEPTLNAFLSDPSELVVQLADIETLIPKETTRFVPLAEHAIVLTQ